MERQGTDVEKSATPSQCDQSCGGPKLDPSTTTPSTANVFKSLSIFDRLLSPAILVTMIAGVLIGVYVPTVQDAFNTARFDGVSAAIVIGLIAMMWPVLTKVQYEKIPQIFRSSGIWTHIGISMLFNWVIGPLIMVGLAWATLPDLPTYRTGLIMVGMARCIAMVLIWCHIAQGDGNYCAILVVINSVLQMILYSPYTLLFVNVVGGRKSGVRLDYGDVAISVLIVSLRHCVCFWRRAHEIKYLGIPLVAGVVTRYLVWYLTSKKFLEERFLPLFGPLAPLGLLYTILVMFAYQGHHIVQNIGPVFRVFVPLILYFVIVWSSAFALIYWLGRRKRNTIDFGYEMAVVQALLQELAIAVSIATYGVGSDEALAATIGPLVEVPVLVALTWVALYLKAKLAWPAKEASAPSSEADTKV
ncbi:sodium bile acid symporter family-domain-containing protein [Mycena belliarum]|uniref:Sodium bile acid symporter family-domain-containing protein n=1 Tax=Mycena belliarum TaxID=1033014 RepID=A0AAD6XVX1_9AGAR|nr:sodium bile acid symporter family-domain-containing protein [Mycena belliae]